MRHSRGRVSAAMLFRHDSQSILAPVPETGVLATAVRCSVRWRIIKGLECPSTAPARVGSQPGAGHGIG
jgi:hypothetical protein